MGVGYEGFNCRKSSKWVIFQGRSVILRAIRSTQLQIHLENDIDFLYLNRSVFDWVSHLKLSRTPVSPSNVLSISPRYILPHHIPSHCLVASGGIVETTSVLVCVDARSPKYIKRLLSLRLNTIYALLSRT